VDGDRAAGCPTVPVVYGLATAVDIVVSLVVGWVAAGFALVALVRPGGIAAALLLSALAIAASVYAPLWRARRQVTRSRALAAHKWLVVERLVLMSGWIAVYAPAAVALGLLAGALLLTVGSQALLRDRYERQRITRPSLGGEHVSV
jgi:4-hydroxybenzoate polyprenyltransferase